MISYYLRPIIARGEDEKRPGSAGSLSVGSTDIPVDSASSYFDVGDFVFVVDTNLGNMSYCGEVLAVDSDSVSVCFGVRFSYDTGTPAYYVIRPLAFVLFGESYSSARRSVNLGSRNFVSASGVVYKTKISDTVFIFEIGFLDQELANRAEVEDFIRNVLNDGLEDFVIAFNDESLPGPNVLRARLLLESLESRSKRGLVVDHVLRFQEVSGVYV